LFLSIASKLVTLDVSGCHQLTLSGFEALATLSAPLTTLLLKDCKNLSDTSLLLLAKFPLTELNVSFCKNLTDGGLEVSFCCYCYIYSLS